MLEGASRRSTVDFCAGRTAFITANRLTNKFVHKADVLLECLQQKMLYLLKVVLRISGSDFMKVLQATPVADSEILL